MTLKSRSRVTQGHWKSNHWNGQIIHNLQLIELFDTEYYCDLEMWVRSHSRSLRILSPDKTEWRLISVTLCGRRRCFVADQLWLMTCIQEEEDCCYVLLSPNVVFAAVPHCRSTQQIVEHFTNCQLSNCPVCRSVRHPSSDSKHTTTSTKAGFTPPSSLSSYEDL